MLLFTRVLWKSGKFVRQDFFFFICFWQTSGSFLHNFLLCRPSQWSARHPRWQPTRRLAVCWDAGFEHGTVGQQSGTLPLSHHVRQDDGQHISTRPSHICPSPVPREESQWYIACHLLPLPLKELESLVSIYQPPPSNTDYSLASKWRAHYPSTTLLSFELWDVGYRISDKSLFRYRYNVRLRSLQFNIWSSDIQLSPISLITDFGLSGHLCQRPRLVSNFCLFRIDILIYNIFLYSPKNLRQGLKEPLQILNL